jgi:hypothetical protein
LMRTTLKASSSVIACPCARTARVPIVPAPDPPHPPACSAYVHLPPVAFQHYTQREALPLEQRRSAGFPASIISWVRGWRLEGHGPILSQTGSRPAWQIGTTFWQARGLRLIPGRELCPQLARFSMV